MGVQIDQVVARFSSPVAKMTARPMTSKTLSAGSPMQNAQNRSESPQMMHLRNNRLQAAPPAARGTAVLFFGQNHPEPSKIRILAIGSRAA